MDSPRQVAEMLHAWSENSPDPDYFFGGGDVTVFSMMQDTCADGARIIREMAAEIATLRSPVTGRSEAEASVLPIAMAFLDKAAGEGVAFSAEVDGSPAMDAADLYDEIARRLGHQIDAPQMLALTVNGVAAIRAIPVPTEGGAE